ncbi:MAG: glycosyltransferase family 2 protein [Muribaculaceae bacterium]|nr:glycosyltransferase family 2 protein [Muribaculaceae bacterium]
MRPLHIIMPMAGEGSRFARAGWTTPKPLIELRGVPLFRRAINSVAIEGVEMKYSFIVRQEHIDNQHIDQLIKAIQPDARVFSVLKTTRGAVETCLVAESAIDDEDAVVVMDCDLEFRSKRYNELVAQALAVPAVEADGGALVSFESDNPRYSYAEIDDEGRVLRTAEKEPISNHALCGAYFFGSGKDFKHIAHQLLEDGTHDKAEFYVSLLYNYLLAEGKVVRLAPMEEYYSYGTPEELLFYSNQH